MREDITMSGKIWPENQRAYDGSQEPQGRELTPLERDIICRTIRDILVNTRKVTYDDVPEFLMEGYEATIAVYPLELPTLRGVASMLSPREENRPDLWNRDR